MYLTDLDEIPEDKPEYYYLKELEKAENAIKKHKEWLKYFKVL